jgi:hypothetical protein
MTLPRPAAEPRKVGEVEGELAGRSFFCVVSTLVKQEQMRNFPGSDPAAKAYPLAEWLRISWGVKTKAARVRYTLDCKLWQGPAVACALAPHGVFMIVLCE